MNYTWFKLLGITAYPLFFCSIVTLAMLLERFIFFILVLFTYEKTYKKLSQQLIQSKNTSKAWRDEMLSVALSELQAPYYRNLKILKLLASIAPMLGLLGTVLGLISTFKSIAAITAPVSPNLVAAGLWEALYTTAYGLLIAIPALFFAHLFKLWGEKCLGGYCLRLNKLSLELESGSRIEPQHKKQQHCPARS